MAITLEQKLDCLRGNEYDAIENLVDIILMNRRDKKSFSDGGEAPAAADAETKIQHKFIQSKHYPVGEGCAVRIGPWEGCRRPKSEHMSENDAIDKKGVA